MMRDSVRVRGWLRINLMVLWLLGNGTQGDAATSSFPGLVGGSTTQVQSTGGQAFSSLWYGLYAGSNPHATSTVIVATAAVTDLNGVPEGEAIFFLDGIPFRTNSLVNSDARHPISGATVANATGGATISIGPLAPGDYQLSADLVSRNGSFANIRVSRPLWVRDLSPLSLEISQFPSPAVTGEQTMLRVEAKGFSTGLEAPSGFIDGAWIDPSITGNALPLSGWGDMAKGAFRTVVNTAPFSMYAIFRSNARFTEADASHLVVMQERASNFVPTIALSAPDEVYFGEPADLVATLMSPSQPAALTGYCTFKVNEQIAGRRGLAVGSTQFSTTALPLGTNTVCVTYNGDVHHQSASSQPITIVVRPPRMKTTITNGVVRMQWPGATAGFVIESTTDPENAASWTSVPDQGETESGRIFEAPTIAQDGFRIFRLRRP